jgi:hypothetical protein
VRPSTEGRNQPNPGAWSGGGAGEDEEQLETEPGRRCSGQCSDCATPRLVLCWRGAGEGVKEDQTARGQGARRWRHKKVSQTETMCLGSSRRERAFYTTAPEMHHGPFGLRAAPAGRKWFLESRRPPSFVLSPPCLKRRHCRGVNSGSRGFRKGLVCSRLPESVKG